MSLQCISRLAALAIMSGFVFTTSAAIIYDETVSGDLSNSGLSPTLLTVSLGSNQIFGTTGRGTGTVIDRDYLTFSVPSGLLLSGITVLPDTTTGGPVSFIGLEAGNQITLPTSAATADGLLGWWHYATSDINTNILPEMAIPSNGSSGFAPPLSAGNYAFWIQDFGAGTFNYGFDFTLTAVPEPRTFGTVLAALAGLVFASRRGLRLNLFAARRTR